jgi:ribosomal protein S26
MEKCPKCGGRMSRGAPHDEGSAYQLECLDCGNIIPVSKEPRQY